MSIAVILIPLISAGLVVFSPLRRGLALLSAMATFIVALFLPADKGIDVLWIPGFESYFSLSPAGAASVLILSAALVMIPTVLAAGRVTDRPGALLALLLVMQAGLNGTFLAKDLIIFYLFWEATLIPSVLMLGIWGGNKRRQAALKYLLYGVIGSFFMLIAILAIKPLSGAESYRIADLLLATPALGLETQLWLFAGFALAFAVKLPIWPFHAWLPDFHEQNHPSGVADVAGTLYKVGGFGFFAWALPLLPAATEAVAPFLMALAAFTALYAAMIATTQNHLKRLLAYASLSHMGMVGLGIFGLHIIGLNGAMFLLAAQMLSTGGLFLISGMLYARKNSFQLDDYGGLAKSAPALAGLSLFVLFTSIGVPGLANFPGEFMSLLGAFHSNVWLAGFATLAVIAAGVYGVNMYQRLYQGEETSQVRDLSSFEALLLIPIVAGILWLGLLPNPQLEHIEIQSKIALQPEANQARSLGGLR